MNTENLEMESTNAYERSRMKVGWSIFFASVGLISLALCSAYAGQADSASKLSEASGDSETKDSYHALSSGYGFASFLFILAFLLFTIGAFYVSPIFCGTAREREALRNKVVEQGDEEQGPRESVTVVGEAISH